MKASRFLPPILFILLLYNTLWAQRTSIDSLSSALQDAQGETRLELLAKLGMLVYAAEPERAFQLGSELVALAEKADNQKYIGEGHRLIGVSYHLQGQLDKALDHYLRALMAYEKAESKIGIATMANNLGGLYFVQENWDEARRYYQESLNRFQELQLEEHTSKPLNNLGAIYEKLGQADSALAYYQRSLTIKQKYRQNKGLAYTLNNIGVLLMRGGGHKEALGYFEQALAGLENENDPVAMSEVHSNIGLMRMRLGGYERAFEHFSRSIDIARQGNDLNTLQETYRRLVSLDSARANYRGALEWYRLHLSTRDSFLNADKNKQLIEIRQKYEAEKKEAENKLLVQEKAQQGRVIWIGGLLVILLVALALSQVRTIRLKKRTNEKLQQQKNEIEHKNVELEQKNEEITTQAESLRLAHEEIVRFSNQLTDSITYARRIQRALLDQENFLRDNFEQAFILFRPRDIVSGDFYWLKRVRNYLVIATVDCTGHGVPGGFLSMLGYAFLNEIVQRREITTASQVLEEMRLRVKATLKQTGKDNEAKDGMDMALCVIDTQTLSLQMAAANSSVVLVRNGQPEVLKGTRNPIGIYHREVPFVQNERQLQTGDQLYLFSDGYADQFGGRAGLKFTHGRFVQLLQQLAQLPAHEQKMQLEDTLATWQGQRKQVDDILVLGARIGATHGV